MPDDTIFAYTVFGAPLCADPDALDAQVGFIGVPYDYGSIEPFIPSGQTFGPTAFRVARLSEHASLTESGLWAPTERRLYLKGITMADCGDVLVTPGQIRENHDRITDVCRRMAATGALVVAIGGDHSVSFPVGRGVMERYGEVNVVHIDAHLDFSDEYLGSKWSHGSNLRRLSELPFVGSISAVGVRATTEPQWREAEERGVSLVTTRELYEDPTSVADKAIPASNHLYVSIDLDVLDAAEVPGTTLPEPGGLPYEHLRQVLAVVAAKGRVVGFDVCELNPPHDHRNMTARTANWIVAQFLGYIFDAPSEAASTPRTKERSSDQVND